MSDLDARQRQTLRAMQDWFVTPVVGYPTTAQADPDEAVLDMVLEQLRPCLDDLRRVLDDAGDDVAGYLAALPGADREAFELARLVCLARYLSCRPVWDVLGYARRKPAPIEVGEADVFLTGLLDAPRRRGKVYRPTPVRAAESSREAV